LPFKLNQERRHHGEGGILVGPARHATEHQLHRPAEFGQAQRAPVSPIAMRAGAVDDEQGVLRPVGQPLGRHLSVRQVQRARHMRSGVGVRPTHIQQHEVG